MKVSAAQLRKYGLTRAQFDGILVTQRGKCAICCEKSPCAIDHDHKTGRVRGLLCTGCNTGLGFLGDNMQGLAAAMLYLMREQHPRYD